MKMTSKKTNCTLILLTLLFSCSFSIFAQSYQISFAGSGAATLFDSVIVENISQCKHIKLIYGDVLNLSETVGIHDMQLTSGNPLAVYPNPMDGHGSIGFEAPSQGVATIELYEVSGRIIFRSREFLTGGHHTYLLNGIGSGMYILKVEGEHYSYTTKIVCNKSLAGNAEIKHVGATTADAVFAASGKQNDVSLKSAVSQVNMQYHAGDMLKLTGMSGIYKTIVMLVATKTQTVTFSFVVCTDADNNNYAVVQIGKQLWMAENLATTKYRDGTSIPKVTDNAAWTQLSTGAYCEYNNSADNGKLYGKIYNAFAVVDARNISPVGWHVASDADLTILTDTLGGWATCGGKLRETCSVRWQAPNTGATNETGFSFVGGGFRSDLDGSYNGKLTTGYLWSSTADASTPGTVFGRLFYSYSPNVYKGRYYKKTGFSVRCVKD